MTKQTYRYLVEQCDVANKNTLEAFRKKRSDWLIKLKTDDHHAISKVVQEMVWNDMSFNMLIRAANLDESSCLHNSLLAENLVNGHFAVQVLAIRRLMDTTRGVISLAKLLEDIKTNIHLFTRENYVTGDGLPYDYETVMNREISQKANKGAFWAATSGPTAWASSQRAHEAFDELCGIAPAQRRPTDTIPKAVIEKMIGKLNGCGADQIVDWCNNLLAHPASEGRRQKIDLDAVAPTLQKINDAVKCFVQITEAVLAYVLFDGGYGAVVAIPQFNQFEHMQSPLLSAVNGEDLLHAFWDELEGERNKYLENVRDIFK